MKMLRGKNLVSVGMGCAEVVALMPIAATAQFVAQDSAQNYSGNWPSPGPNNGFGFGAWSFNNTTPNGGFSGQFLGSSGGIDTGGNSFGFYANGGASAQSSALRPFSQSLTLGQSF